MQRRLRHCRVFYQAQVNAITNAIEVCALSDTRHEVKNPSQLEIRMYLQLVLARKKRRQNFLVYVLIDGTPEH